jgi:hypothetical protein
MIETLRRGFRYFDWLTVAKVYAEANRDMNKAAAALHLVPLDAAPEWL